MKTLFDKVNMNGLEAKNRFVRSATWEGMADENGHLTDNIYNLYEDLAKGGVGLIITGYAKVFEYDEPAKNMLGIYDDTFVEEYKKLTSLIHKYDSKVIIQIVLGKEYINKEKGLNEYGFTDKYGNEDIDNIKRAFKEASRRAKEAGFDGVQIHGAHGYFLSRTLSPKYNTRSDKYGGSVENRGRLILEVYDEMRKEVGKDYHISIKINSSDFEDDGATFEECKYVCKALDERGIDSIEISGMKPSNTSKQEAIYKEYGEEIAKEINAPVFLVGLNRTVDRMNEIINSTKIECISICRPFICQPDLVNKFENLEINKVKCVSCGKCVTEEGIRCILNK
ncbi:NADH oxidase [Gottschalkia purinilytica]|uniref:NADH oxidase n=1 Tax=Gottschalkia purinilytica TaxID=1503 RepID=A0A0L0W857_GOTPU|nr:NADH:flavin oxidoreductase [Gottschalkia purinilytica]KNF07758.1 NADH oxidase [Gottschalkia purinilytica]